MEISSDKGCAERDAGLHAACVIIGWRATALHPHANRCITGIAHYLLPWISRSLVQPSS
jgi:hypothetical protein